MSIRPESHIRPMYVSAPKAGTLPKGMGVSEGSNYYNLPQGSLVPISNEPDRLTAYTQTVLIVADTDFVLTEAVKIFQGNHVYSVHTNVPVAVDCEVCSME